MAKDKFKNLGNIDKAMDGASMKTSSNMKKEDTDLKNEKMKKLVEFPKEWNDIIKNHIKNSGFTTVNQYIVTAIYEKLEKDGLV